jgi:Homeodomain-like domain
MVDGGQLASDRGRTGLEEPAEIGCDVAAWLGGGTDGPSEDLRRALLLELYEQGLTRQEIAERMGICADWVRQLLKRYEVPALTVWERRYRRAIAGRESEIVAAFMRLRSYGAVARQYDLPATHVRRLIESVVPEAGVLCRARRTSSQIYSDEELLDALRTAALDAPSPLSIESYSLWVQHAGGERRWPGSEAIKLRFGGWRRALGRADLPTNSRHGPQAGYRYGDVVTAVAAAWRELGRYPSVTRYDAWRAGRAQLPVAATARHFVRSWDDILLAAYPFVYPAGDTLIEGLARSMNAMPSLHAARPASLASTARTSQESRDGTLQVGRRRRQPVAEHRPAAAIGVDGRGGPRFGRPVAGKQRCRRGAGPTPTLETRDPTSANGVSPQPASPGPTGESRRRAR